MTVYVCYFDYGWDGHSIPCAVFAKEEDAIAYCKKQRDADYQ